MGVTAASSLTLGEGSTPLVPARRLQERLGLELHLKCDGLNPTGSFKDRGMVVAVERAARAGARAVVCASTGNTAASAAAYAARAGLQAIVLTPAGATATAKRAQARAAGARLLEVRGSFDDALRLCRELGERDGFVLVNSLNPDRIEGQKSVVRRDPRAARRVRPTSSPCPSAAAATSPPSLQASPTPGSSPRIVVGQAAERATTWASAIRIVEPAHAVHVAELVGAGRIEVVTLSEDELRDAWQRLSREEGVFCEPASAAGVAALERLPDVQGATAVCIVTGHGLKDAGAVDEGGADTVEATLDAVLEAIA